MCCRVEGLQHWFVGSQNNHYGMNRRFLKISLGLGTVSLLMIAGLLWRYSREPRRNGTPLSVWLGREVDSLRELEPMTAAALDHLGEAATPDLIHWLSLWDARLKAARSKS
jgi:hypothetical protein